MELRLGSLVRERRRELKLTQDALAERSGISQTHISQIEMGKTQRPELETLQALATALDVPVDELRVASGWVEKIEVVIATDAIEIQVRGEIPGNVDSKGSLDVLRVLPEMIGDSRQPFAVRVVDDSWRALGIVRDHLVILEQSIDRKPEDGRLVVATVNDDDVARMYRWSWANDGGVVLSAPNELGEEVAIARVAETDVQVIGLYVYNLPPVPARNPATAGA